MNVQNLKKLKSYIKNKVDAEHIEMLHIDTCLSGHAEHLFGSFDELNLSPGVEGDLFFNLHYNKMLDDLDPTIRKAIVLQSLDILIKNGKVSWDRAIHIEEQKAKKAEAKSKKTSPKPKHGD